MLDIGLIYAGLIAALVVLASRTRGQILTKMRRR